MSSATYPLIIGLGNPEERYTATRHNAGVWFVEKLAEAAQARWQTETELHARLAPITLAGLPCRLMIPTTFMNESGRAVQAVTRFYRIESAAILIAHDEIDLPAGTVRLKKGGGHAGHNGLRDIIASLNSNDFARLRIGVGRPPIHTEIEVADYVLQRPSVEEKISIDRSIEQACSVISDVVQGNFEKAMQALHTGK